MADARMTRLAEYLRPGRFDDTDQAIVARLEELQAYGPEPAEGFRVQLRERLMELAPEALAEGPVDDTDDESFADLAEDDATVYRLGDRSRLRTPLLAMASAAALILLLLGVSVWISHDALPGDALYGVKRANENAQVAVTHGDAAKGRKYLHFARQRIDEVFALLNIPSSDGSSMPTADGISQHTQDLVAATLQTSDDQTIDGTALINKQAVTDANYQEMDPLVAWLPKQRQQLKQVLGKIPRAGTAWRAAEHSLRVVSAAATRVHDLSGSIGCRCVNSSGSDPLGPLPCGRRCANPQYNQPPSHQGTLPGGPYESNSSSTGRRGSGTTNGSGKTAPSGTGQPAPSGTDTSGGPLPPLPTSGLPLPSLPAPPVSVPSVPTTDTCIIVSCSTASSPTDDTGGPTTNDTSGDDQAPST
jgi:Domain of unknown function (DUF5667)